ncbi:MAG: polysaccharide deacetylase family protein [Acidobacteria bacterium]|nr:polysaccharide deacetylase family protein [Acidobacteriota bacterium]
MKRQLGVAVLLLGLVLPCLGVAQPAPEWGMAVLEVGSSKDARQEQLALRNCLELLGIPFVATTEVEEAVRRPFVVTGGILFNTELTPTEREVLYAYVERGGVLLATQVQGNMFFPLFGLVDAATSRTNFSVHFTDVNDPALRYLNRPEERSVSLGDPSLYSETVWSTEYTPGRRTKVLAQYENGAAALTLYAYGRGLAYALGLGFKETTLLPQLARSFEAARRWINSFEPSGDVFRLLLRGLYEDSVHPFLLVHTVPEGRETALVLSHDVDARESFRNSLTFARMEASLGVRSTFFVTTKYFRDATDIDYYTPDRMEWIKQVREMGFEVGSHSVSHSLTFDEFPLGSQEVDLQSYRPARPTVSGEVRVSKQLLDRDLNQDTKGFRAGYLRYPNELLRVLEESGYGFDSSVSAQYVLTNFPYFGFRRRALDAEQSNIVVVPVTLDDSRDFLTPKTQEKVLRTWTEIIRANAENGATTCLLIHPTDTSYKLQTERRLIAAHLGDETWIGDVGSLARFWRDRARLRPVVRRGKDGGAVIVLNLRRAELPSGQALVVEAQPGASVPQIVDAAGEPIAVRARTADDRVVLLLP